MSYVFLRVLDLLIYKYNEIENYRFKIFYIILFTMKPFVKKQTNKIQMINEMIGI